MSRRRACDTVDTGLEVSECTVMDGSACQHSLFKGNALRDAQPVKADERGTDMLRALYTKN